VQNTLLSTVSSMYCRQHWHIGQCLCINNTVCDNAPYMCSTPPAIYVLCIKKDERHVEDCCWSFFDWFEHATLCHSSLLDRTCGWLLACCYCPAREVSTQLAPLKIRTACYQIKTHTWAYTSHIIISPSVNTHTHTHLIHSQIHKQIKRQTQANKKYA
jgi:hypothetical protein